MSIIESPIASQFDRLPPHSVEAEMCTLASMMLNPECIADVCGIIRQKEAFFQADHQILFERLQAMYASGNPIDAVLLRESLNQLKLLEEVGGTAYLSKIINTVPSAAHAIHYAGIVRDKWLLRQLIAASNDTLRDCYGAMEAVKDVVDRAAERTFKVSESIEAEGQSTLEALATVLDVANGRISPPPATPTGFYDLDSLLDGGIRGGELIVVGARPSMGKTAFGFGVALNIAECEGPVVCYSLEMRKDAVLQRMLAWKARVPFTAIRKGMTSGEQREKISRAVVAVMAAAERLNIDDSGTITVTDLVLRVRSLHRRSRLRGVFIDYLGLMVLPEADTQALRVGMATRALKNLARDLDVPVVLLSQLNRAVEGRDEKRPRMSDLRDSGCVEQDADVIMLLHREDYYHIGDKNYTPTNTGEVAVVKQRNGPCHTVELVWNGECMAFCNKASVPDFGGPQ